ncbi:uncharacterized protein [Antedon mediterranea]|uniref:uncharacterized protein n=1 Tax=Antedon mediterranea TaxID=105859 RepID=UPI003AF46461
MQYIFVYVLLSLLGVTITLSDEVAVEDEQFKRALYEETEDALANVHTWLYPEVSDTSYRKTERSTQSLKHLFSKTSSGDVGALARIAVLMERHVEIERRNLVSQYTPTLEALCEEIGFGFYQTNCSKLKKYRTINGTCNNLDNVHWGAALTPMPRFLAPDYADGVNDPREAPSPRFLPSPRLVSSTVVHEVVNLAKQFNTLVMHTGQYLDHDIGHSPEEVGDEECHCTTNDRCLPIKIPDNDPFFNSSSCIEFLRSSPVPGLDCKPGPRQQLNQITSFLDLSSVYGSHDNVSAALRNQDDKAYLKVQENPLGEPYKPYLPVDEELEQCVGISEDERCVKGGDLRTSEQPGLVAMHTIFMRQHNAFAKILYDINPQWKGDVVFEEARKINYAIWQRIIYNEFLPIIIGREAMLKYDLTVLNDGFFLGYSAKVDPSAVNVFSHAAFRFGHSLIPSDLKRVNHKFEEVYPRVTLREAFFNASFLFDHENGGLDSIVLGMLSDSLSKVDTNIDDDVTKHLFAVPAGGIGLDLVALNIQRGRDHGLPAYNEWRYFCELPKAKNFDDLRSEMSASNIRNLQKVYESVDDIDAFIGFISETAVHGALVGKTLGCIIAKQFRNFKFGDRFWHENGNGKQAFTIEQLNEIRKMTMARVLCENLNEIESVQPRAFEVADEDKTSTESTGYVTHGENKRVSCGDYATIPTIRLQHWIEYEEPLVELDYKAVDLQRGVEEINRIEADLGQNKRQHPPGFEPVDPNLVPSIPGLCPENGYDKTPDDCLGDQTYRSFDGSCNNLLHPNWGKAIGPLARLLPPAYGDGSSKNINAPRRATDGSELPNARKITSTITVKKSPASKKHTALLMSFGQFLDHDFALSPEKLTVCTSCKTHGECFPIPILKDDYYFRNKKCLHFTRSRRVKRADCKEHPEEQQNIISSYIDLSMVYGTSDDIINAVRDQHSDIGLLRTAPNPQYPARKDYLPFDHDNSMCFEDGDIKCGLAGDFRAPEQVGLTSLHTMFLREHNRIATELSTINPHWDSERLYQETRRILIAMWQFIVYNEYIHLIIGSKMSSSYNLYPLAHGSSLNHYDRTEDVTILNEFSTAAFRMGHSMIPPSFIRVDEQFNEAYDSLELSDVFFNATHLFNFAQGGMDSITLGLTASPVMKVDNFFTQHVSNHLFAEPAGGPGNDLISINIQRGRDHGIPSYTALVFKCFGKQIRNFQDLGPEIDDELIGQLQQLYTNVHDIDLFIGGTAETPQSGATVGRTLACIIGVQFNKLKHGDRFWFENKGTVGAFTIDQVDEIRKASLARIICDNLDNVARIQPKVLVEPDEGFVGHIREPTEAPQFHYFGPFFPRPPKPEPANKRVSCSNTGKIPRLNLKEWKEY